MSLWITRPPDGDWHFVDRNTPGPAIGRALLLAACGRSFAADSREYRLLDEVDRIPERRRCPYCQAAYLKSTLA